MNACGNIHVLTDTPLFLKLSRGEYGFSKINKTIIRESMLTLLVPSIGRIRRFTCWQAKAFIQQIGLAVMKVIRIIRSNHA